jgi:hypothetical protein
MTWYLKELPTFPFLDQKFPNKERFQMKVEV